MSNSDLPPTGPPDNDPSAPSNPSPDGFPTSSPGGAEPNPDAAFSQGPANGADQGQWYYPPRRSSTAGFFDSIRRSGLVRTEHRWVGGVAGGVAQRLGVDATLVRCIWVVLSILTGLGAIIYALGWAFLPEESDGRIHVEQALVGDVSAGLAGSILFFIAGLASADDGLFPTWLLGTYHATGGLSFIWGLFWVLFWVFLISALIIWLIRSLSSREKHGPQPHPGQFDQFGRPVWNGQPWAPRTGPANGGRAPGRQQTARAEGAPAAQAAQTAGGPRTGTDAAVAADATNAAEAASTANTENTPKPSTGAPNDAHGAQTAFAPESTGESRPAHGWTAPGPSPMPPRGRIAPQPGRAAPMGAPTTPFGAGRPAPGTAVMPGMQGMQGMQGMPSAPPRSVYAPRPVPPPRPRIPGPGKTVSLLVIGLALIGLAVLGMMRAWHTISVLQTVFITSGGLVLLLAGGIVISALRGRRGGWMTGFGWLAALVALPLLAFGSVLPPDAIKSPAVTDPVTITLSDTDLDPSTTTYPTTSEGAIDLGTYGAGSITLDLRQVTRAAGPDSSESAQVHLAVGTGRIRIKTNEGQKVRVGARPRLGMVEAELGSPWILSGSTVEQDHGWSGEAVRNYTVDGNESYSSSLLQPAHGFTQLTSPATEGTTALDVDAQLGTGAVQVEESSPQVRWRGSTQTSTWVVDYWTDSDGVHHGELPVEGMTHPAVGSDDAEQCLEQLRADDDSFPDAGESSWRELSELSSAQRSAYENCLTTAWEQGKGTPGSTPATTPSATPSPTPTN